MRRFFRKLWIWLHVKLGLITHEVSHDDGAWGCLQSSVPDQIYIPFGRYVTLREVHNFGKEYWTVQWGEQLVTVSADRFQLMPLGTRILYRLWMM